MPKSMNKEDIQFWRLFGLAVKAGKVVSGHDLIAQKIRQGKVKLLLLTQDAGLNTLKQFRALASYNKIALIEIEDRNTLNHWLGKENRSAVAICEEGFAERLLLISKKQNVDE